MFFFAMLSANSISCQRGRQILWENLNLVTQAKTLHFIRGANGIGKSSLLKILAGIHAPVSGQICWENVPIQKDLSEFHRKIVYLGHTNPLKGDLNAIQNLQFLLCIHGYIVEDATLQSALLYWGLSPRSMSLPTKFLSQGQKQRVCLALLSLSQSVVWLLDEPFNGLDQDGSKLLMQTFADHLSQNGSIVLTSHLHLSLRQSDSVLNSFSEIIFDLQGVSSQ